MYVGNAGVIFERTETERAKLCVTFDYDRFRNRIVFFVFLYAEVKDADELANILRGVWR